MPTNPGCVIVAARTASMTDAVVFAAPYPPQSHRHAAVQA
jgi:hypothetical protein